ncbi:hypothetical protein [Streptomyces sp. NPDC097610]|uniref:hypothetical protein n=1 Tax=Streptomyces sp. NPDC097610 TaxID=3157227 RepID=UPI00332BBD06
MRPLIRRGWRLGPSSWDDAGNQTASTTPGGITTSGTYNPAGEARAVTGPVGTTKADYAASADRRTPRTPPTAARPPHTTPSVTSLRPPTTERARPRCARRPPSS